MSRPTADTETPSPSAISGSMPMTTNSVLPIPKAPMARASRARGTRNSRLTRGFGYGGRRRPGGAGMASFSGQEDAARGHARVRAWVCSQRRPRAPLAAGARGRGPGSGREQHLDRAVLLLAEVGVGLGGLRERDVVGGEAVDAEGVLVGEQREDVRHPPPDVGLPHAQLDLLVEHP